MKWRIIQAVVAVVLVIGILGGVKALQINTIIKVYAAMPPPSETVSSAVARKENWQDTLQAIGSVTAVQGVTIMPEVAGTVSEIAFESGAVVAKGDLLVRLDTSSEAAQLRASEAQVELARLNVERTRTLRSDKTVSQADLDTAEATWSQQQAEADTIRAAIGKKTIRAPFAGRLGIRLVNLGEFLDMGKPIVSLQSLSPVYADYSLPQQNVAQLANGLRVQLTIDAYTNRFFEGALTAVNPDLDALTRSVRLQATLENPGELLRPGMFARVETFLPTEQSLLVVPATCVLSAPYGDSVFVIASESATNGVAARLVARQRFIRTSRTRGDFVAISAGLKEGDKVASSGLFKLRNGVGIIENNELVPPISETPRLPDR